MHAMASEVADSVVDAVARGKRRSHGQYRARRRVRRARGRRPVLAVPAGHPTPDRHELAVTTDEAVALIAALLADGAVHSAWLHGRGGR